MLKPTKLIHVCSIQRINEYNGLREISYRTNLYLLVHSVDLYFKRTFSRRELMACERQTHETIRLQLVSHRYTQGILQDNINFQPEQVRINTPFIKMHYTVINQTVVRHTQLILINMSLFQTYDRQLEDTSRGIDFVNITC